MRVVIAGGSGFLGRHVVETVVREGHDVVVLARGTRHLLVNHGVESLACDVTRGDLPLESLRGCDAIVNLVGIKKEDDAQTFERAHVDATRHLLTAAGKLGIRRFVHISVVCSRPHDSCGYHDTKWRAEQLVRQSGLDFTILKPGVIYGRGDDMITHLVKMIRFAAVFPVVGRGTSLLQPVSATDVARVVSRALEREIAVGKTYDVVGPRPLPLREVVQRVAQGVSLRTWIIGTPVGFQRVAVRLMSAVFRNPLSTPAQLEMLVGGMAGDPVPVREDLGIETTELTPEVVRELEEPIPALFGLSLRLADSRRAGDWIRSQSVVWGRSLILLTLAVAALLLASKQWSSIWYRMAAVHALMIPATLSSANLPFRELLAPRLKHVVHGTLAALLFYAVAWSGFQFLTSLFPSLTAQADELRSWQGQLAPTVALPLLILLVIPGEEILWRGAITLPVAARLGPWAGCLLGGALFSAFHIPVGPPLLLIAAFAAGTFWSWLTIKSRSLVPPLVCHLLWDLAVIYCLPLQEC